jgi:hypothetical protein
MEPDVRVWLEAILQRDESAIAADWLKEQPSAVIVSLLEALKGMVERRVLVLTWIDKATQSEAYFSERSKRWIFTRFHDEVSRDHFVTPEWVEVRGSGNAVQIAIFRRFSHAADVLETPISLLVLAPRALEDVLERTHALPITRVGTAEGQVLVGAEAEAWWQQREVSS